MKQKVKIILFIFILSFLIYKIYLNTQEWLALVKIYESNDILSYSKYAITNGTDADWRLLGAKDVETNYESGRKYIALDGYSVDYQAYDKREDILGTVMEKKTGRESLYIDMQIGYDLYLGTSNFKTNNFSFCGKYNIYSDVVFCDGMPAYKETYIVSMEDMREYCNDLLNYIEDFQEISKKEFLSLFQSRKSELQTSLVIYYTILFLCVVTFSIQMIKTGFRL